VDLPTLRRHLREARTVAVVGCSPREGRAAHFVPRYLQAAGLRVVPVNPHHEELLGERCYPDLLSIPEDVVIDIVDVFRRPEFVPAVVQDVADRVERAAGPDDPRPLIFTQVGVHHPEAQRLAEAHGLPYVANRCLMVDHRALAA
jgi:predicted CoA-binding protein